MVIVELSGGLGNQLYQYAFGRFVAHKLNSELKLDLSKAKMSLNPKHHGFYRLGDFNIQANIATPEEIDKVKASGIFAPPLPPEDTKRDIFISGHSFHSEEAFIGVADTIRREFTLKNPLHSISAAWAKKILAHDNSVALHIRRGDYLKSVHIVGVIPLDYYRTCVKELKKAYPDIVAFIFSDDINWVRENLKLEVPTEYVKDCESDNEEFFLMSLCKHTVIANSTFSWWAAWLNPNPDKKIFAPSPWSRSGLWDNGIPKTWTRIPVDYENVPVDSAPLLSIIVYARNNFPSLGLMLYAIFNQTLRDYELIIIDDASTDGSENIFRKIYTNKKVTLIKCSWGGRGIGKAAAFNKGLDYARGEYVLFLGGDDLIFPYTVQALCQAYSSRRANIFCAVNYLQENPDGDTVSNINGKRYFQYRDEKFKALNAPYLFTSNDLSQRLMMTSTHVFNPLLGTKFFKRDFLAKNSIRFNENLKAGFELHFIINAIMASNEIMFIPAPFYIAPSK